MTGARRFIKGQVIYYASHNFAIVGKGDATRSEVRLGAVIERQVDACGVKKVTFYDRSGQGSVFGMSDPADSPFLFATPEEAFQFLCNSHVCDVICPDVYSDADRRCFEDLRSGKMRIAAKC